MDEGVSLLQLISLVKENAVKIRCSHLDKLYFDPSGVVVETEVSN